MGKQQTAPILTDKKPDKKEIEKAIKDREKIIKTQQIVKK